MTGSGLLLLALSVTGVAIGLYMAADERTRHRGRLFALLWAPALAASSGVLTRDGVTFVVGLACFLIAGTVFFLEGDRSHVLPEDRARDLARGPAGDSLLDSEKPTKENEVESKAEDSGRVAS